MIGACNPGVTKSFQPLPHTYDTPGVYQINWQITSSISEFGQWLAYDAFNTARAPAAYRNDPDIKA